MEDNLCNRPIALRGPRGLKTIMRAYVPIRSHNILHDILKMILSLEREAFGRVRECRHLLANEIVDKLQTSEKPFFSN